MQVGGRDITNYIFDLSIIEKVLVDPAGNVEVCGPATWAETEACKKEICRMLSNADSSHQPAAGDGPRVITVEHMPGRPEKFRVDIHLVNAVLGSYVCSHYHSVLTQLFTDKYSRDTLIKNVLFLISGASNTYHARRAMNVQHTSIRLVKDPSISNSRGNGKLSRSESAVGSKTLTMQTGLYSNINFLCQSEAGRPLTHPMIAKSTPLPAYGSHKMKTHIAAGETSVWFKLCEGETAQGSDTFAKCVSRTPASAQCSIICRTGGCKSLLACGRVRRMIGCVAHCGWHRPSAGPCARPHHVPAPVPDLACTCAHLHSKRLDLFTGKKSHSPT